MTLFDEVLPVTGHLFWVHGGAVRSLGSGRDGQENGLCGAADDGILTFTTGTHTGAVPVRLEFHYGEPSLDAAWEEVVEVSFHPDDPVVRLTVRDGPARPVPLDDRHYRVRYCAVGFDNERTGAGDPPERYLVQFWPAPAAPDRVLRQTSDAAAAWHRVARETPLAPAAAARAEAVRRAHEVRQARADEQRRKDVARRWSGRAPEGALLERLRPVEQWAVGLAALDRDLLDDVALAEPPVLRAMSRWAARHTCERAGLAGLDWVAAALDALDRGDGPPPWFADFDAAFARWRGVPRERVTRRTEVVFGSRTPAGPRVIPPEVSALTAVVAAREDDPLVGALRAVQSAAAVDPAALAAFRVAFGLRRR